MNQKLSVLEEFIQENYGQDQYNDTILSNLGGEKSYREQNKPKNQLGKLPFIPNFQFRPLQNQAIYKINQQKRRQTNNFNQKKMKTQSNSLIDYSPTSLSQNNSTILEKKFQDKELDEHQELVNAKKLQKQLKLKQERLERDQIRKQLIQNVYINPNAKCIKKEKEFSYVKPKIYDQKEMDVFQIEKELKGYLENPNSKAHEKKVLKALKQIDDGKDYDAYFDENKIIMRESEIKKPSPGQQKVKLIRTGNSFYSINQSINVNRGGSVNQKKLEKDYSSDRTNKKEIQLGQMNENLINNLRVSSLAGKLPSTIKKVGDISLDDIKTVRSIAKQNNKNFNNLDEKDPAIPMTEMIRKLKKQQDFYDQDIPLTKLDQLQIEYNQMGKMLKRKETNNANGNNKQTNFSKLFESHKMMLHSSPSKNKKNNNFLQNPTNSINLQNQDEVYRIPKQTLAKNSHLNLVLNSNFQNDNIFKDLSFQLQTQNQIPQYVNDRQQEIQQKTQNINNLLEDLQEFAKGGNYLNKSYVY